MSSEFKRSEENYYLSASEKLNSFVASIKDSPYGQKNWKSLRETRIATNGENSIVTLLPKNLNCDTVFLTMAFNRLAQCGIFTKEDLRYANLENTLRERHKHLGKKTLEFAKLMQNVVRGEEKFYSPFE